MKKISKQQLKILTDLAGQLGFMEMSWLDARIDLSEYKSHYIQWLQNHYHGEMEYLTNHLDKRFAPYKLMEGAKTIFVFLHSYFPAKNYTFKSYKIARYAYGKDYHKVLKKKLKKWVQILEEMCGNVQYRIFTDSAPLLERQIAQKAGLGWIGKNSLLLNRKYGSYFFIAEVMCDVELDHYPENYHPDPFQYCGSCTRCLDACPTNAIISEGVIDANLCISHATIESKQSTIDDNLQGKLSGWIFGCDICQEVCPWNRFSIAHNEPAFFPVNPEMFQWSKDDWKNMDKNTFEEIFAGTPLRRMGYNGLQRNIKGNES